MSNAEIANKSKFDLEERTAKFGESIIDFAKSINKNFLNQDTIRQLIRAGTSIGANYCEADCAESKKDFEHKLGICKKEVKETKYWLRIIVKINPEVGNQARLCWREANELNLIFASIIRKSKLSIKD